jgi:hypothetical protein
MPPPIKEGRVTRVAILSRDQLLAASDLTEKEIELPTIGGSVRIRALAAEYSNAAVSQAIKVTQGPRGDSVTSMDNGTLELLQVQHGLVEPRLESLEAVRTFAKRCGPAFKTVVREIVELSGLSEEAVEQTTATFPDGGELPAGQDEDDAPAGNGGPPVHARAGA